MSEPLNFRRVGDRILCRPPTGATSRCVDLVVALTQLSRRGFGGVGGPPGRPARRGGKLPGRDLPTARTTCCVPSGNDEMTSAKQKAHE